MKTQRKRPPGEGGPGKHAGSGNSNIDFTIFNEALEAHGLTPPVQVEPNCLVRFLGIGKNPSNRAGWLKQIDDGNSAVDGDFTTDLSESCQARKPKDKDELARWRIPKRQHLIRLTEMMEVSR